MGKLYVDWNALDGRSSMGYQQARRLLVDAFSKSDHDWRTRGDEYAAGVADAMTFALTVLDCANESGEISSSDGKKKRRKKDG